MKFITLTNLKGFKISINFNLVKFFIQCADGKAKTWVAFGADTNNDGIFVQEEFNDILHLVDRG